ncbi:MAG: hypothetical protein ACP5QU_09235 [Anaerolineae bacterium]
MPLAICLNCQRSEEETPLLVLTFKGETRYLCAQCLPILIHRPQHLAEKFPGARLAASGPSH